MTDDEHPPAPGRVSAPTRSAGRQLAVLLVVAAVLRLAVGFAWQERLDGQGARFGFGDSEGYWYLGRAIARGEPYRFGSGPTRIFRTPGYPILLAPIFLAFGDDPPVLWARAQSALFGTLAVAAVYLLGRQLFDRRTGIVAAAMATFYPGLIALSALVLTEAPFCALFVLNLSLWSAAWNARSAGRCGVLAFATGLLAAATALVRPSWLLFIPFAVGVGLLTGRPKRRHAGIGGLVFAGVVVGMLPWWVRNAGFTGHFVPTTLQVGASLYDGLNPRATGASDMWYTNLFQQRELDAEARGEADLDEDFEYRLDRRHRDAALEWARAHPGRVARLAAVKFLRIWNIWPNEAAFSSWPIRLVVTAGYLPVVILGLLGVWKTTRRGWPYVLCWLPAVYFTLLHMIFVGSIRYRDPAMLGLMVLAAAVVVSRGEAPD
jgi:4-amino-4-deoxy-L-arabinose transferase-like glycosyltransferase